MCSSAPPAWQCQPGTASSCGAHRRSFSLTAPGGEEGEIATHGYASLRGKTHWPILSRRSGSPSTESGPSASGSQVARRRWSATAAAGGPHATTVACVATAACVCASGRRCTKSCMVDCAAPPRLPAIAPTGRPLRPAPARAQPPIWVAPPAGVQDSVLHISRSVCASCMSTGFGTVQERGGKGQSIPSCPWT